MKIKHAILFLAMLLISVSCGKIREKAKEGINKSGETIGKSATEFVAGVADGVEKTLVAEITLPDSLTNRGVKTGKFSINNLPEGGTNNLLTVYLIFDKAFKSTVTAKAFDKNGLETGRAKLEIEAAAGTAGYYNFAFDRRTHIEAKSRIELE